MEASEYAEQVIEQVEQHIDGQANDYCVEVLTEIADKVDDLLRSFGVNRE